MIRFTPKQTPLTLDDIKIATLSFILAKQRDEKFVINITTEDSRFLDSLSELGIKPDDIIYQDNNLKFHQQLATKLLMDKKAFNCFCKSRDDENGKCQGGCENLPDSLVLDNESPFSVRLKGSGEIEDFIILKVDKLPSCTFATAIDDMLLDINLVINTEDEKSDEIKQAQIRKALGYEKEIKYIHLKPHEDINTFTLDEEIDISKVLEFTKKFDNINQKLGDSK